MLAASLLQDPVAAEAEAAEAAQLTHSTPSRRGVIPSSSSSSSQMISRQSMNPLLFKEARRTASIAEDGLESTNGGDTDGGGGEPEFVISDRVIMAVALRNKKLGCCYYSLAEKKLYMMEDVLETDQLELLHLLIMQVSPDVIITNSRSDERMIQFIEHIIQEESDLCGGTGGSNDNLTTLTILPSSVFTFNNGKSRLLSTLEALNANNSSDPNNHHLPDKTEALLHLESIVSSEKTEMVGCCGALLGYLTKLQIEEEDGDIRIHNGGGRVAPSYRVDGLSQFALSEFMHINADTLRFDGV
jgi:hypothetical protein